MVIVVSDNGASGEGGPDGSVNEMLFMNGIPDDITTNLAMLDELGGPKTYNHYPNGWAMAFNTPFKMWKRYEFNGGTSDPCVISWPAGMTAKGEIREQYHHAIDLVPTVLDALGIEAPDDDQGPHPEPLRRREHALQLRRPDGARASGRRSSTRCWGRAASGTTAGRPSRRTRPSAAGRTSTTTSGSSTTSTSTAPSCTTSPPSTPTSSASWSTSGTPRPAPTRASPSTTARRSRSSSRPRPQLSAPRDRYVYFPNHAEVPEAQAVVVRGRSFVIGALVDLPEPGAQGVLFAQGSRFGGHSLYVKDNRLHYVNSFVGMFEQKVVATEDLPVGENLILSASFEKDGMDPPPVATGILSLYHGDTKVGEGRIKLQPGSYMIAGEGLAVGRDVGDPVTRDYPGERPYRFTGGTIKRVAVDVSGEPYIDLEREAQAMLMRE